MKNATTATTRTPVICYPMEMSDPEHPGVRFALRQYGNEHGKWECVAVLVHPYILDVDYVLAAAVKIGRLFRITAAMRKAVKEWQRWEHPEHVKWEARAVVCQAEAMLRG